jgi:alpha-1,2-mannosyltransferase
MAAEAFFYHKATIVPWNLVSYNILSGPGRGPDIFGTEPVDYYLRNLILNFNIWVILALMAAPLLILQYLMTSRTVSRYTLIRSISFTIPFYMWLIIFTTQRHKEERFMYPAYPFLVLNAALALHALLGWFGNPDPKSLLGKIPAKLKLLLISSSILLAMEAGLLRTMGTITAYRAPLQVYEPLKLPDMVRPSDTVCIGKEWFRFPSSYFLPNGVHAKFIKSEYDGLLPGEFKEANVGFGFFPGTWMTPTNMNDQNLPDPTKYVSFHGIYVFKLISAD